MNDKPLAFANTARFYSHFGWFWAAWTAMELNVDLAICRCTKVTPEQAHMIVAPLEFGRKAALLRSLLPTSDFKNVSELKGYLTRIGKESLRNVFAHSFIASTPEAVTFVKRDSQGEYSCTAYEFPADGFVKHVKDFVQLAHDFEIALGFTSKDIGDFAAFAIKESKP